LNSGEFAFGLAICQLFCPSLLHYSVFPSGGFLEPLSFGSSVLQDRACSNLASRASMSATWMTRICRSRREPMQVATFGGIFPAYTFFINRSHSSSTPCSGLQIARQISNTGEIVPIFSATKSTQLGDFIGVGVKETQASIHRSSAARFSVFGFTLAPMSRLSLSLSLLSISCAPFLMLLIQGPAIR